MEKLAETWSTKVHKLRSKLTKSEKQVWAEKLTGWKLFVSSLSLNKEMKQNSLKKNYLNPGSEADFSALENQ